MHPEDLVEPYDLALKNLTRPERRAWSESVLASVDDRVGLLNRTMWWRCTPGAEYREYGLAEGLRRRGVEVVNLTAGLGIGKQLAFYRHRANRGMKPNHRPEALDHFYELLDDLAERIGGLRTLSGCSKATGWPTEVSTSSSSRVSSEGTVDAPVVGSAPRSRPVEVHVWGRLSQHRGSPGGPRPAVATTEDRSSDSTLERRSPPMTSRTKPSSPRGDKNSPIDRPGRTSTPSNGRSPHTSGPCLPLGGGRRSSVGTIGTRHHRGRSDLPPEQLRSPADRSAVGLMARAQGRSSDHSRVRALERQPCARRRRHCLHTGARAQNTNALICWLRRTMPERSH